MAGTNLLSLIAFRPDDLDVGVPARRTANEILPLFQVELFIGDRLVAIRTAMRKLLNDHLHRFIRHSM